MKKLLLFTEQAFTVAVLLIYSGAILTLVLSGGMQENEVVEFDSSLIRVINLFIYIVTFVLLVLRWKKTLYVFSKDRWIFPLIMLAAVSVIWSFEPGTTIKDSVTLIGSSLFGVYLAARYTLKQQLQLLGWTFGIAVVLSFIFAMALPSYGIMGGIHQGRWRGVFIHKNGLGAKMVNSGIVFLLLAYQSKKRSWLMWGGLSLSILLLVLADSTSSVVNLLVLVFAFFVFRTFRWPYIVMIPTQMMLITMSQAFSFWLSDNADVLFASIGRDATLTGRADLWPFVMEMIWQQPWFGYGYGGFWQGLNGESAYVWRAAGWTPTHPHNGFLALWLDLGLFGLVLFFIGFWRSCRHAFTWVRSSKTAADILPAIHLTYIATFNLTESALLDSNTIVWVLYIALVLSLPIIPKNQEKLIT
jgi:exopolysaccharide production protein ExoQ